MNKNLISCLAFYFLISSTTPSYTQENKYFYNKISITNILKEPLSIYNSFRKNSLFKIIDNANDLEKKWVKELNKHPYNNFFEVESLTPFQIGKNIQTKKNLKIHSYIRYDFLNKDKIIYLVVKSNF